MSMTDSSYFYKVYKLSRGEICLANLKAPLQMVQVWTGFLWPIGTSIQTR